MTSSRPATVPARRTRSRGASAGTRDDGLGFYRMLAGLPGLQSYRAKLFAVVVVGTFVPTFLLVVILVLGAGRLSLLAVLAIVAVLGLVAVLSIAWAIDRLLAPLGLATQAIDDIAHGSAPARADLPGNDAAAQVLRGVQALVARVAAQDAHAREAGDHDALTGLLNRRAGREAAQTMIDERTRRGEEVRIVVVDVDGFRDFNASHGTGHGDAVLKLVAGRIARVAGSEGVAARWSGDAFLLAVAHAPGEGDDLGALLGRPIVVKGMPDPLTVSLGIAHATERASIDVLCSQAEATLPKRGNAS